MTRSLRTLGLTLIGVLALGALAASSASAETALVTGGPAVHGADAPIVAEGESRALTASAGVECEEATYSGTAVESTITIGLEMNKCQAGTAPITVTDNGCAFNITLGALSGHSAPGIAALECPAGKQIERHIYADSEHKNPVCTKEIPPQTGLTGLTVTDQTNGHLLIHGTVGGITYYLAGGCATQASGGLAHTINPGPAELHVKITVGSGLGLVTQEE